MRQKIEWRSASKTNYKDFCKTHPTITISFLEWKNIIYGYSEWFRNYILESGEKAKLPNGLGEFSILKMKRNCMKIVNGEKRINLPIDWVKTMAKGKRIYNLNYETEGYFFKWYWFKRTAQFILPQVWYFKPCRTTSRMITHYLRVDPKYQHIYREWQHNKI